MGSRDEGGVCTPPLFVICHGGTGWVVASRWGAAPADDGRHRVATGAGGAPAGHGTPRQPPGHFGRRPNWANAAGNPPPDSGALCVRQRLHGIPRSLEGEELRGVGVVFSQLHEQDSRCAGWRGERALSSPSDRGIRDRGDCQARCRSSQPKIRFRTSGRS